MPVRKPTPQEIYDRALQAIADGRWQTAQRLLEALYHIAPNYEDTAELRKFVNATIKALQKKTTAPPTAPSQVKAEQKRTQEISKSTAVQSQKRQIHPSSDKPTKHQEAGASTKPLQQEIQPPQINVTSTKAEPPTEKATIPPQVSEKIPEVEDTIPQELQETPSLERQEQLPHPLQPEVSAEQISSSQTLEHIFSLSGLDQDSFIAADSEITPEEVPYVEGADAAQKPPFTFSRNFWIALILIGLILVGGLIFLGEQFAPAKPLTIMERMQTLSPPTETPTLTPSQTSTSSPLPPTATATEMITVTPSAVPLTTTPLPTPTLGIGSTFISPLDGMTMVYVPEGEFLMGPSKKKVYLDAFWIDQTEVTNEMYIKCIEAEACSPPARDRYKRADLANHPVVWVNWFQAKGYCQWAGKRLPTEAEWEKAARGVDGRTFPWGNDPPKSNLANICDQSCPTNWSQKATEEGLTTTMPVGSYPLGASPYQAYDMAGNVWEWVADWYDETTYYSPPEYNPKGPKIGKKRVVRGGSWTDLEAYIRVFHRDDMVPQYTLYNIGFRCAKSP